MSLISELQRRNVFRVAFAYLAGAWLLIQILETLFPIFGLPETSARIVVIILAIGFIPALIGAWVFEFTAGKLVRDTGETQAAAPASHNRFDRIIIATLLLAIVIFSVDTFILDPARDAEEIEAATKAARTDALIESFGDKSIAVLPFTNMSSDPEQEYFSDGIAEEMLNLLSRVEGLRVISRTSAFVFKDSPDSLSEIAEKLDVGHILEGSVRKSGKRVRITAQLIEAHSDTHLWSDTYDREIDDIFAIQDEVAAHVVEQLKVTMAVGLSPVERHDPVAYTLYLQARQLLDYSLATGIERAEQLLLQALEIEPDLADAKMGLVEVYWWYSGADDGPSNDEESQYRVRHETLLREVAANEPDNATLNVWLAWKAEEDFAQVAEYLERAFETDPSNKEALNAAMLLTTRLGRFPFARAIGEYLRKRDPILYYSHRNVAEIYIASGAIELAENAYRTADTMFPGKNIIQWRFGLTLLFQGKPGAALEQFQQIEQAETYRLQGTALALFDLGRLDESASALTGLTELLASNQPGTGPWPYGMARAHAWMGDADNAFSYLAEIKPEDLNLLWLDLHGPFFARIKDDPRWLAFLESIGRSPAQLQAIEFNPALPAEILKNAAQFDR
jgi:TolB-like protein/Tfp pilus assembly protein PilF